MSASLLLERELLYQALASPLGLVIRVSDFGLAQQRLYKARRDLSDPDLSKLQFRRSPVLPEGELWIVKEGKVELPKRTPDGKASGT